MMVSTRAARRLPSNRKLERAVIPESPVLEAHRFSTPRQDETMDGNFVNGRSFAGRDRARVIHDRVDNSLEG